jgi:hypothetical protein
MRTLDATAGGGTATSLDGSSLSSTGYDLKSDGKLGVRP